MPDTQNDPAETRTINLVLEGGGVKAVAHVGALTALQEHDVEINRVAGASAGAVVAALVSAKISATEVKKELDAFNFLNLMVPLWRKYLPSRIGKVKALLFHGAMYDMSTLRSWLDGLLRKHGVVTFEDLKSADGYRLTVAVTDLTRGEVVYLPRDYWRLYGRQPDGESVVDAVCASAAFPFFFRPQTIEARTQNLPPEVRVPEVVSTLIDGGVTANYPIDVFDGPGGSSPSMPTLGIKLLPRLPRPAGDYTVFPTPQPHVLPIRLLEMMTGTMIGGRAQAQLDLGSTSVCTVYVDTSDVSILNFKITPAQRQTLYENGLSATNEVLKGWP